MVSLTMGDLINFGKGDKPEKHLTTMYKQMARNELHPDNLTHFFPCTLKPEQLMWYYWDLDQSKLHRWEWVRVQFILKYEGSH